jgi:hypothetical protein
MTHYRKSLLKGDKPMKKLFLPILIVLLLALAACGGDPAEIASEAATRGGDVAATAAAVATDVADGPDSEGETEVVREPTEEPTATPEPTAIPVSGMSGQVVDSDSSEPLVGGQVCVQGAEQCASVDESGMYSLAELDPAEYVFEVTAADYVTATQTISLAAGETLTQDFALTAEAPILTVLPTNVVLRGGIFCVGPAPCTTTDAGTPVVGATFEFLDTTMGQSVPEYNLTSGQPVLGVILRGFGNSDVSILVPKRSETELGQAANAILLANRMTITAIGDTNQALQRDDQMEVVLTDSASSNPPYTVNFYRGDGEARQLVSTFTIDKQQ